MADKFIEEDRNLLSGAYKKVSESIRKAQEVVGTKDCVDLILEAIKEIEALRVNLDMRGEATADGVGAVDPKSVTLGNAGVVKRSMEEFAKELAEAANDVNTLPDVDEYRKWSGDIVEASKKEIESLSGADKLEALSVFGEFMSTMAVANDVPDDIVRKRRNSAVLSLVRNRLDAILRDAACLMK